MKTSVNNTQQNTQLQKKQENSILIHTVCSYLKSRVLNSERAMPYTVYVYTCTGVSTSTFVGIRSDEIYRVVVDRQQLPPRPHLITMAWCLSSSAIDQYCRITAVGVSTFTTCRLQSQT